MIMKFIILPFRLDWDCVPRCCGFVLGGKWERKERLWSRSLLWITVIQRWLKMFTQWWTFAAVETEHSGSRGGAMWCWHLYLSARRSYKIKFPVIVSHSEILLPKWLVTSWFLSLKCHKFKLPVLQVSFLFCQQWTKGGLTSHITLCN